MRRRRLAAVGALASALCMLVPAAVSAHLYSVDLDCDGLHVQLSLYTASQGSDTNTLRVYVDGDLEHSQDFSTSLNETFPIGSPYQAHDVHVEVRAWDDNNGPNEPNDGDPSWSFDWDGSVGACMEPTPRPTPEPTPKPTPKPTPRETNRPHRTPRPTPKATEIVPPTIKPGLKLPPTDTVGDYTGTGGGSQGLDQGILFLLVVLAGAGGAYGIRTTRRRSGAKR
jgi:hypothetical protein